MSGRLSVVGLGPGADALCVPAATAALAAATDLVGYGPYLARVAGGQTRHASDNGDELDRARLALALAESGRRVAVVSGGDAGVFGMAAAVFEAMEAGPEAWRALDVEVVPGISAMLAAAARLGAPLGHDFCVLSLSDNLKPWDVVCRRLRLAAEAGLVIVLYNARSRARPDRLGEAFALLAQVLPPATRVAFATAISRPDESVAVTTLDRADPSLADMRTLVIVGSAATRLVGPFLYTPRSLP